MSVKAAIILKDSHMEIWNQVLAIDFAPIQLNSSPNSNTMRSLFYGPSWILLGTCAAQTSTKICPLLGPAFPMPSGLSSNEQFQAAANSFDAGLTTALETGISTNGVHPYNATTFSIGMISTSEKDLIYQRHYTDPSVRDSIVGTQNVDADSIYRLGSISKLLTAYLLFIRD
jgi:hypothetical protein